MHSRVLRLSWLVLSLSVAAAADAASAGLCDDTERELRTELAIRPSGPEDPEALRRVDRVRSLFALTPARCAEALHERLGEEATEDELSHAFHYAFATATRKRLREQLQGNFAPYDRLEALIEAEVGGAAERETFACWIELLRRGKVTDQRAIPWNSVCPEDDLDCPERDLTDAKIASAIRSKADVEAAAAPDLPIFRSASVFPDMVLVYTATEVVQSMQDMRRGIAETKRRLQADDLPPHYAAMKDWIEEKEKDPASVLYCPGPLPEP